jgi:hypothetical protein
MFWSCVNQKEMHTKSFLNLCVLHIGSTWCKNKLVPYIVKFFTTLSGVHLMIL